METRTDAAEAITTFWWVLSRHARRVRGVKRADRYRVDLVIMDVIVSERPHGRV